MSLLPTTRRAEEFSRMLDSGATSDDPALAPLVGLSRALTAMPAPAVPRPEFRAALGRRLVAVATVQAAGETAAVSPVRRMRAARITWRAQRRIALVAGAAAAVTAIAGVGVSASRSLPGDPFYALKRAAERVQLAAAEGQEAKGKRHLEFARTRLAEIRALAGHSSALGPLPPGVPSAADRLSDAPAASTLLSTLGDMDTETRQGVSDLYAAFRSSGSKEPLLAVDRFTQLQYVALLSVVPELPATVQPRAKSSLLLLQIVATDTVTLARTAGGAHGNGGGEPVPAVTATPSASGSGTASSGTGGGSATATTSPSGGLSVTTSPTPTTTVEVPTLIPLPTSPLPATSSPASILPTLSPLPSSLLSPLDPVLSPITGTLTGG